jgi:hypothetical protein
MGMGMMLYDEACSGLRADIYNAYMRLENMENANKYKKYKE